MSERRPSRGRWVRVAATICAAVGLASAHAATARADTASISFTDAAGRSDPAAGVGRTLTVTGNTTVSKQLFVLVRDAGGAPCAPSAGSDSGSTDPWEYYFSGDHLYDETVNGNFTLRRTGVWPTAGAYMFCIWLASSDSTASTPITQVITFRSPTGTISGTTSPITPLVHQQTTITITGSSEAPKQVYATIRRAGGAPCASSYDADSGDGLVDGTDVNGAFSITATTTPDSAGSYLVCLWLADSSSDGAPVAGPQPVTFNAVVPPRPCVVPKITPGSALSTVTSKLTHARCALGALSYAASRHHPRGSVLRLLVAAGTSLNPGTPVGALVSTGRPCVVPRAGHGLRLSGARWKLRHAGCRAGRVHRVHSGRRKGTVTRFSPRTGRHLPSRAKVQIYVSRGR